MGRLVIEEDTVYEVDEDCLCKREEEENTVEPEETSSKGASGNGDS
ncbi:MAG: hypothetical protein HFI33_12240 [Lachnospiraceae bacterium]|nr:hypothetical protein [Lachnospiraceae bacterium]